ncbi:MAG: hypothetical protein H0W45_05875 [Acidobacteria bacterium]|jgi:hypothetical protein|nr:hypothetical protein [Acidobacteriota bacterium]
MKKFLALSLLLLSAVAFVPSAEAKSKDANSNLTANNAAAPQIRIQVGRGNRRSNQRATRIVTRNVRRGRQIYRETYRVTYNYRNGRTRTELISRVRIGRY